MIRCTPLALMIASLLWACPSDISGPGTSDDPTPTEVPDPFWYRVDDAPQTVLALGADMVVTADGHIYVSWVYQRTTERFLRLSRSRTGGLSFEESLNLTNVNSNPSVGPGKRPRLTVGAGQVIVSFDDGDQSFRADVSRNDEDVLTAQSVVEVGPLGSAWTEEFAQSLLTHGGNLLTVVRIEDGGAEWLGLEQGADNSAYTDLSAGVSGIPSADCPLTLFESASGDVYVAWRNDVGGLREQYVRVRRSGQQSFDEITQVTDTGWVTTQSPFEAPVMAQAPSGRLWMAFAESGSSIWRVRSIWSDDGIVWNDEQQVAPDLELGAQRDPRIAIGPDGRIWIAFEEVGAGPVLYYSDDEGMSFERFDVPDTDEGTGANPVLAGGGDAVYVLVGGPLGTLWLGELPEQ